MIRVPEDRQLAAAVGKRMAEARKALGLTQAQLAAAMKISQPAVANYETGRKVLSVRRLSEVAAALGVTSDHLLGLGQPGTAPAKRGPRSRLELQMAEIANLPPADQRFLSQLLDRVLTPPTGTDG